MMYVSAGRFPIDPEIEISIEELQRKTLDLKY